MTPDNSAQVKQIREHAKALRVDISGARAAGADSKLIEMARHELVFVVKLTLEAIEKGYESLAKPVEQPSTGPGTTLA